MLPDETQHHHGGLMPPCPMLREAAPAPPLPPFADLLEAPLAAQRPHQLEMHGDVREDPYYW